MRREETRRLTNPAVSYQLFLPFLLEVGGGLASNVAGGIGLAGEVGGPGGGGGDGRQGADPR